MNKKGFTLIELLAVVVILALIVAVVVPKIMSIIQDTKISSMETSAKLVAKAVEKKYELSLSNGTIDTFSKTGSCIEIGNLDTADYKTCMYKVDDEGNAVVTLEGTKSGNFSGLMCYKSTSSTSTCEKGTITPVSFETDSWTTIFNAIEFGLDDVYNVGDTKEIDLGYTFNFHTLRIANKSTPSECTRDGFSQTACGFVIEFADVITNRKMNTAITCEGGWPASEMRTYINDTIYNLLPNELKNGIIDTFVVSSRGTNSENDSENWTSTDKLYLLSTKEVWGVAQYDTNVETRQLDYYYNNGVELSTNNTFAIKKNLSDAATNWWLRSAIANHGSNYLNVSTSGNWGGRNAGDNTYTVSPAFRIG